MSQSHSHRYLLCIVQVSNIGAELRNAHKKIYLQCIQFSAVTALRRYRCFENGAKRNMENHVMAE